jgi:outer membrane protein assembly factor BamB
MPATVGIVVAGMTVSACHLFDVLGNRHAGGVSLAWLVSGEGGGTPAFDGSTVYYIGADHYVHALDPESGSERWRSPTGTTGPSDLGHNCVTVPDAVVCGDDGIAGFRSVDGTKSWRFDAAPDEPGRFPIAASGGIVFAGSHGHGTVYAIDGETGASLWTTPVLATDSNGVNVGRIAADSDIVVGSFVRGGNPFTGGVIALDARTGETRWVTNFPLAGPDSDCAGLSVALWRNVVLGSSSDGKIYMLDRATGAIQSFFPGVGQRANVVGVTGPVGQDNRPITVSGTTLYAASSGNWLIAYDLTTRAELWRVVSRWGSALGDPIVTDGAAVYVEVGNGHLTAFSSMGPSILWDLGSPHPVDLLLTGSVAVSDDMVFGAGTTGFWAIKKP